VAARDSAVFGDNFTVEKSEAESAVPVALKERFLGKECVSMAGYCLFDENVGVYEKWRPRYVEDMYSDIIAYASLSSQSSAIEIGIGTGQATEPFLRTGCAVTAIEIGKNLAEFVSCRYAGYPKFRVENTSFEEFAFEPQTVDLIYSATAFHWIPSEIGYPKAFDLLRSGGSIALFWNRPFVNRSNDPLHKEIQSVYMKYRGEVRTQPEYDENKYRSVQDAMSHYGFVDVRLKLYHTTRQFSGDDYVGLLNTYSDHLNMETSMRLRFEADIKKAIESFGGIVTVYDTIDLHMGRKP